MPLNKDFQFSQGSLQDFLECRRRFFLRYVKKVRWPAVQTEPVLQSEQLMQQGAAFHHSIHQYLLGIPAEQLIMEQSSDEAALWWNNFLKHAPKLPGVVMNYEHRFPEHTLVGIVEGNRLIAKYDLITIQNDKKIYIYDWKTSRKKPRRTWLKARMQTLVYPYLLVLSGKHLTSSPEIKAEQVVLVYWFASIPEKAETFIYDQQEFERSQHQLADLIKLITRLARDEDADAFPLTDDQKQCSYCVYRSLCNRGTRAGQAEDESESDIDLAEIDFSFDQISEIAF
jgi:CRISPR/Cas system-associated exonuclease Cas4 (RecB family)